MNFLLGRLANTGRGHSSKSKAAQLMRVQAN